MATVRVGASGTVVVVADEQRSSSLSPNPSLLKGGLRSPRGKGQEPAEAGLPNLGGEMSGVRGTGLTSLREVGCLETFLPADDVSQRQLR